MLRRTASSQHHQELTLVYRADACYSSERCSNTVFSYATYPNTDCDNKKHSVQSPMNEQSGPWPRYLTKIVLYLLNGFPTKMRSFSVWGLGRSSYDTCFGFAVARGSSPAQTQCRVSIYVREYVRVLCKQVVFRGDGSISLPAPHPDTIDREKNNHTVVEWSPQKRRCVPAQQ